MRCIICRQADLVPGHTTVTLERGGLTLVIKSVPAQVCPNCGEAYLNEDITTQLLEDAEVMAEAGMLVDVRHFVPA